MWYFYSLVVFTLPFVESHQCADDPFNAFLPEIRDSAGEVIVTTQTVTTTISQTQTQTETVEIPASTVISTRTITSQMTKTLPVFVTKIVPSTTTLLQTVSVTAAATLHPQSVTSPTLTTPSSNQPQPQQDSIVLSQLHLILGTSGGVIILLTLLLVIVLLSVQKSRLQKNIRNVYGSGRRWSKKLFAREMTPILKQRPVISLPIQTQQPSKNGGHIYETLEPSQVTTTAQVHDHSAGNNNSTTASISDSTVSLTIQNDTKKLPDGYVTPNSLLNENAST